MKNKTWAKIALNLDYGGRPKSDSDHFAKFQKRKLMAQVGTTAPDSGYAISPMSSQGLGTYQQNYYSILNSLLDLAPYDFNLDNIDRIFQSVKTQGAAEIGNLRLMLSQVPMTRVKNISSTSGSIADPTLVGVATEANPDFICLQQSNIYTPIGMNLQIRNLAHLASYFGKDTNIKDTTLSETIINKLTPLIDFLADLEEFFRVCTCNAFKDCATEKTEDNKGKFTCVLGTTLAAQKNSLKTPSGQPKLFTDLVSHTTGDANCRAHIENFQKYIDQINSGGDQAAGRQKFFWEKLNKLYADTITNASGWEDPDQGQGEPNYINTLTAFMVFISSMCQIAIQLRSYLYTYNSLKTAVKNYSSTDNKSNVCDPYKATMAIARWYRTVYGSNKPQGAFVSGIPRYVLDNWDSVMSCADNINACIEQIDDPGSWIQKFSWADQGLPYSLPQY